MDEDTAYCFRCDELMPLPSRVGDDCPNECGTELLRAYVSDCGGGDRCDDDDHHYGLGCHLVVEYD